MFTRVSKLNTLIVGSLETNTGSEFLFGYDPDRGLKWLERFGKEYSRADEEWAVAEQFIRARESAPRIAAETESVASTVTVEAVEMGAPPATVTRSEPGDDWVDPYPMEGDERIVGDMSTTGRDIPDDDIAGAAERFLMEMGEA